MIFVFPHSIRKTHSKDVQDDVIRDAKFSLVSREFKGCLCSLS